MQPKEFVQIGIGNPPALADIDGAQLAEFDPVAHGRLGHLQAVSDFLDGLILILAAWLSASREVLCRIAKDCRF
jgi:hypothetical protein